MAELTITAANVLEGAGAVVETTCTFGETITIGMPVYKHVTTGKLMKAVSTSAAAALVYGITLNGGSLDQPAAVIRAGTYVVGATLSIGEVYVLAETAGKIQTAAETLQGEFVTVLGIATTAANLLLGITASGIAHA